MPETTRLQLGLFLRQGEVRTADGRVMREPIGWSELRDMAQAAEGVGFDTLWLADHFLFRGDPPVQMEPGDTRDVWECFTLLAALAVATNRVDLGPLVACAGYRNPALLAKIAQTLDEVSDGRLILGLGAGWHRPEYEAYGYPYDHRVSRLEEALAIIVPLLREGHVTFRGEYFQAVDCELRLGRSQLRRSRPNGPPIWLGAHGPRMLRLTARYADAFNTVWYRDAADVAEPFRKLDVACEQVGRDPATVRRTSGTYVVLADTGAAPTGPLAQTFRGRPDEIAACLRSFEAAGVTHMSIVLDPWTVEGIERFGAVIQALRY